MTNRTAALDEAEISTRMAALGDPTRRAVLHQLRGGPRTVGEIANELPVSRPAVSQHLRALSAAGLVLDNWEGTRHYFTLNAPTLLELRRYFEDMWQDAMRSFARHVEKEETTREKSRSAKRGR